MLTNQITNHSYHLLRLLTANGIGNSKSRQIMKACRDNDIPLDELFRSVEANSLLPQFIMKYSEALRINETELDQQWKSLLDKQVNSVSFDEKEYPERLLDALGEKAPLVLFYKGNLDILNKPSAGFCGSRRPSIKGLETARDCAGQLAREGVNIISGYAHGVDMAVHIAALEAGGTTTIILAEGILNFKLKRDIQNVYDQQRTLIISEFIPGLPWSVRNAMKRNSTLCGLSNLTILIEAQEQGGSFNAGKACLKMGRPLFAPVYYGMPESAVGNRLLLEEGALSIMKSKTTGKAHMSKVVELLFDK
ncbi:MAG: DNA-processing protein DprA [Nitrospirae bacterium]|nr:DNA-processing protein DprA [Nitrospirota bacterium]